MAIEPRTLTVGLRMTQEMHDELARIAQQNDVSMGAVIRTACTYYLWEEGHQPPVHLPDALRATAQREGVRP